MDAETEADVLALTSRNMSKRSGSAYLRSSRLAAPIIRAMSAPSSIVTPASSVSRMARRRITVTGGSQRTASSNACGNRERSL